MVNEVNGKVYIGQTLNVERRFRGHNNAANRGSKCALANAIRKYGIKKFAIEVLHCCSTRASANMHEVRAIRLSKKDGKTYNLTSGGEGFIGGKHTKEWKKKMSKIVTGRIVTWGDRISAGKLGKKRKPFSKAWRRHISEGMKGIVRSQATKNKIRKALKGVPFTKERRLNVSKGVRRWNKRRILTRSLS